MHVQSTIVQYSMNSLDIGRPLSLRLAGSGSQTGAAVLVGSGSHTGAAGCHYYPMIGTVHQ